MDQKTYFAKVDRSAHAAILDFAGGVALQVVSKCPGAARLLSETKAISVFKL